MFQSSPLLANPIVSPVPHLYKTKEYELIFIALIFISLIYFILIQAGMCFLVVFSHKLVLVDNLCIHSSPLSLCLSI